jgi:hypothetical protein
VIARRSRGSDGCNSRTTIRAIVSTEATRPSIRMVIVSGPVSMFPPGASQALRSSGRGVAPSRKRVEGALPPRLPGGADMLRKRLTIMRSSPFALAAVASFACISAACTADLEPAPEVGAATAEARSDRLLTKAQARAVLRSLDGICSDTWCAGDFFLRFRALHCSKSTASCQLEVEMTHEAPAGFEERSFSCTIGDIHTRSDVMRTFQGQVTYAEAFYWSVDACVAPEMGRPSAGPAAAH